MQHEGVLAHWPEVAATDWLQKLVVWEEEELTQRSLERLLKDARIGRQTLAGFLQGLADALLPRCDQGIDDWSLASAGRSRIA